MKWKCYSSDDNTWVTEEDLNPDLIEAFEATYVDVGESDSSYSESPPSTPPRTVLGFDRGLEPEKILRK